ncbi:MAG TPA: hypothetical protein VF798_03280 [Burkholderiaceae bacterium]
MKKSLVAFAGVLAGAAMFAAAAPASAHDRIAFGISFGVPVAPVTYVAPQPVYVPAPAPVVVSEPVVEVGAPVYYGPEWRYYHGYHGYWHHDYDHDYWRHRDEGYRGYHGYHDDDGYRGWHR